MPMENRKDVTVSIPGEWYDIIEDELGYGDSMSGWVRDAVGDRLQEEGLIDENDTRTDGGSVLQAFAD